MHPSPEWKASKSESHVSYFQTFFDVSELDGGVKVEPDCLGLVSSTIH